MRPTVAALSTVALLSACTPAPKAPPEAARQDPAAGHATATPETAQSPTVLAEVPPQSPSPVEVDLTLPPGWEELAMDGSDLDETVARSGIEDPAFRDQLATQLDALAGTGGQLFAADFASPATSEQGYLTSATLLRFPVGALGLDDLAGQVEGSLRDIGGQDVRVRRETLPVGDVLRARYRVTEPDFLHVRQYYVLDGQGQVVNLSLGTDRPDQYRPVFDDIAATLQLG